MADSAFSTNFGTSGLDLKTYYGTNPMLLYNNNITGKVPSSSSSNVSSNSSINNSESSSSSSQKSSSFNQSDSESNSLAQSGSGIDWNSDFMKGLTPELEASYKDLPGQIDNWMDSAQTAYRTSARDALKTTAQDLINSLASRNMSGTPGDDAFSKAMYGIANGTAQNQYQASADAAKLKMTIPQILGELAKLGQTASSTSIGNTVSSSRGRATSSGSSEQKSVSSGSSSGGSSSSSQQVDPLAPFELMANVISGMY